MLKVVDKSSVNSGNSKYDIIITEKKSYKSIHTKDSGVRAVYTKGSEICIGNTKDSGLTVEQLIEEYENSPYFGLNDD